MAFKFYPAGSVTNAALAGSIANAKLANSAITIAGSSVSLGGSIAASALASAIDGESMALTAITDLDIASAGTLSIFDTVTTLTLACSTGVTVSGNAIITGDLTVNGTTTTVSTTNTVVQDALIELGNGTSSSPSNDAGIVIERGTADNAFMGFDESADKFIVGTGSFTGSSTGNLTVTTGTLVANIEGNVTGNVTGNADTATKIASITNSDIVQLTETQTLTNKTLTSPTLTTPALGTPSAGVLTNCTGTASGLTAGTASVATTVTITDNESTSETNALIFTAGGALTGGNLGLESDGDLTYTPSSGTLAATVFSGNLTLDGVAVTAITTSSESFSDSDTTLMTAKAIADKIESYGYGTGGGDISSVVVTADDSNTVGSASGAANFTLTGGTGIASSVTGTNILSVAIDSTVATLSGSQTLTNKTLTSPAIATPSYSSRVSTATPDSTSSAATNFGTSVVDGYILVTAPSSDGTYLEKLPAVASGDDGKTVTIKLLANFDSDRKLTISTSSSQHLDGSASGTVTLDQAYASITFLARYASSTGQWLIVG